MSTRTQSYRRAALDHFEPEVSDDPQVQRKLRGYLEQIDYTAFASNREVIGQILGQADAARFQRLAIASATARARWVAAALTAADASQAPSTADIARLADQRAAYEELSEAYEALRRMVERGYLAFTPAK